MFTKARYRLVFYWGPIGNRLCWVETRMVTWPTTSRDLMSDVWWNNAARMHVRLRRLYAGLFNSLSILWIFNSRLAAYNRPAVICSVTWMSWIKLHNTHSVRCTYPRVGLCRSRLTAIGVDCCSSVSPTDSLATKKQESWAIAKMTARCT